MKTSRSRLGLAIALLASTSLAVSSAAHAQDVTINIPAQSAADAITMLAQETKTQILFDHAQLSNVRSNPVSGRMSVKEALSTLLKGSGLGVATSPSGALVIRPLVGSERAASADDIQRAHTQTDKQETPTAEIIVTAQRKSESVYSVPVSMTALSQVTMDKLHIESTRDLVSITPGLSVSASDTGLTVISVRGILSTNNAPTTQLYIDETPIAIRMLNGAGSTPSPEPDIFDLDRVEVLRGPQGTLFGASAMGGAIRFITPEPGLTSYSGNAKAELSFNDSGSANYELGAALGGPIVRNKIGFRASGWYSSLGGYIDQVAPLTGAILRRNANGRHSYTLRPALEFAPSDDLQITGSVFYQNRHADNPNIFWKTFVPDQAGRHPMYAGATAPQDDKLLVASLNIRYNVGSTRIVSDTSYLNHSHLDTEDYTQFIDANLDNFTTALLPGFTSYQFPAVTHANNRAWQQEVRASSTLFNGKVDWVAGLYYRHSKSSLIGKLYGDWSPISEALYGLSSLDITGIPNYIDKNGAVLNAYTDYSAVDVSKAAFGALTYNITPRLKLDAGLRVERTEVLHQSEFATGPSAGELSLTLPDAKATPVTPRLALTYRLNKNNMIYASMAKGFRAGGGNPPAAGAPQCQAYLNRAGYSTEPLSFGPDYVWSYELGAKGHAAGSTISYQASAFWINWSNIQSDVVLNECGAVFTVNRGKVISRGFDLQVGLQPTPELSLNALIGYDDVFHPDAVYSAPNSAGVSQLLVSKGEKIGRPWQVAFNGEYRHNLGNFAKAAQGYVRFDFRWLSRGSKRPSVDAGYDPATEDFPDTAYGLLNLRAGVTLGRTDFSLFINNLTNSRPRMGHLTLVDFTTENLIPPRSIGATAWYRF